MKAAVWLGRHLQAPGRGRVAVVATRASGRAEAYPDVAGLAESLDGVADVFEVVNAATAWALTDQLPPDCQVYGGMTRVYPPGVAWVADPDLAPLTLAFSFADRQGVTSQVASQVLRLTPGLRDYRTAARPRPTVAVAGHIMGLVGERALVKLAGNEHGVIWPELVADTVPLERLFAKGMAVSGPMDVESRIIDVRGLRLSPAAALAAYKPGLTVPVRVCRVEPTRCQVELFPGVTALVEARDIAPGADPRLVISRGEVLLARIVERDEDTWLLSIHEAAEAAAARPAASLLPGGPPWLLPPPDDETAAADDAEDWLRGLDGMEESTPEDLADALAEIGSLRRELHQAARQAARLEGELKTARQQLTGARTRRRALEIARDKAERRADGRLTWEGLFNDEAEQMDFEIRVAWARRIPAADKPARPLAEWGYSAHFFATLKALQGVDRGKIVDVLVEVLTGLDREMPGRERHPLRTGPGGDDPQRFGPNGEPYYRVALQTGTPGARRLHFSRAADGRIEFSSVRHHDDLRT
jgi:hypothetical protein